MRKTVNIYVQDDIEYRINVAPCDFKLETIENDYMPYGTTRIVNTELFYIYMRFEKPSKYFVLKDQYRYLWKHYDLEKIWETRVEHDAKERSRLRDDEIIRLSKKFGVRL